MENSDDLDLAIAKFEQYFIRLMRYMNNISTRDQKQDENLNFYVTTLHNLAKSSNFCECLYDSLLQDCIVLSVREIQVQKIMLQHLTLILRHMPKL